MCFNFLEVSIYVLNMGSVCLVEERGRCWVGKRLGFGEEKIVVWCGKIKSVLGGL